MSRVSGSFASILQGVSEQPTSTRGVGRVQEQVNMLPDPVHGLTRRRGTRYVANAPAPGTFNQQSLATQDTDSWETIEHGHDGKEYLVMLRKKPAPGGTPLPPVVVYNRTDKVFLTNIRAAMGDPLYSALIQQGAAAVTSLGKFLLIAPNNTPATGTSSNLWSNPLNAQAGNIWIRGGAYDRTFTVTITNLDNSTYTAWIKTPSATYPEELDTSRISPWARDPDGGTETFTEVLVTKPVTVGGVQYARAYLGGGIWGSPSSLTVQYANGSMSGGNVHPAMPANTAEFSWGGSRLDPVYFSGDYIGAIQALTATYTSVKKIANPDYGTQIAQATQEYNNKVNEWTLNAAKAVTPEGIAQSLNTIISGSGGYSTWIEGSTIRVHNIKDIAIDDGGDGTLAKAIGLEVSRPEDAGVLGYPGQVLRVRPAGGGESFYLRAVPKDGVSTTGLVPVRWEESAGFQYGISGSLLRLFIDGSDIVVGSTAAYLNGLVPGDYPEWEVSKAGDDDSNPQAYFVGRQITYLGVFQDRLLIGSGGVLRVSRTGDYFNMYRRSVLTVAADDAFEMVPQGVGDDTLLYGVQFAKDLILFGKKNQYALSGKVPLSPTNAAMPAISSHKNTTAATPKAVGQYLVYGSHNSSSVSLSQFIPAQSGSEVPESYSITSQVDTYLSGELIEITSYPKPTHLFVRTTGDRNSVFVMSYLDKEQEGRVQDAWHKFEFGANLGPIIGMASVPEGLLLIFYRKLGNNMQYVADLLPLQADLDSLPYLDSMRTYQQVLDGNTGVSTWDLGWQIVFDDSSLWWLVGDHLMYADELLLEYPLATGPRVGMPFRSYVVPTNPYVKDHNGKPVLNGRLTVTKLVLGIAESPGIHMELRRATHGVGVPTYRKYLPAQLQGRDWNRNYETIIVQGYSQSIPIGSATEYYRLWLDAETWMPLTITTVDWVGQFFHRRNRL